MVRVVLEQEKEIYCRGGSGGGQLNRTTGKEKEEEEEEEEEGDGKKENTANIQIWLIII